MPQSIYLGAAIASFAATRLKGGAEQVIAASDPGTY